MFKKILVLLLVLCMCFAVGCKKNEDVNVDRGETSYVEPEKPKFAVNPLTGIEDLDLDKENDRPVAITVNNISVAQKVQTGLYDADIVYETEVEGGITRLVAVFQDITKTEKIGTVRSARYPFIDLAMGHNAIYVHHGQDSYHAGPHLKDLDHFVVGTKNGGERISNGLASEHTLYAYGDKLWDNIKSAGFETETDSNKNWANFTETVTFENAATSVSVPFSNSYKTTFNYNTETAKYTRFFNGTERKDYVTNESLEFKNVFVLLTTIRTYPNCNDGYGHKQVLLESGDGYYFVNGTYTPMKWSKGNSSNGFTFTNVDGTELSVNQGNSWVCIANMSTSNPIIQ